MLDGITRSQLFLASVFFAPPNLASQNNDACPYDANYLFGDPSGGLHAFTVLENVEFQPGGACPGTWLNGGNFKPYDHADKYQAILDHSTIEEGPSNVNVVDSEGTDYYFWADEENHLSLSRIKDKNGNTITATSPATGATSGFTLSDTLGRQMLSLSSWGSNGTIASRRTRAAIFPYGGTRTRIRLYKRCYRIYWC